MGKHVAKHRLESYYGCALAKFHLAVGDAVKDRGGGGGHGDVVPQPVGGAVAERQALAG